MKALHEFRPYDFPIFNLGWVNDNTKFDVFSACDVLAMPSISDAFGLTYLEAWSSGKPVIGAKNTAAEDVIRDGVDGFLINFGSIEQLEDKLLLLYVKSDLRERLGAEGKLNVKHKFKPEITVKAFELAMEKTLRVHKK